jgi:menaquinone-dependent protoporphyrinogen oxidase
MRIAVIYATRYGHGARVAGTIARLVVREYGPVVSFDVEDPPRDLDLSFYDAAILVCPIYFGKHLKVMERFVARNLTALSGIHTAFLSISGSAIAPDGRTLAEECVDKFVKRTGWVPDRRGCFGGAVSYTQYGWLTRFIMTRKARQHGQSTDITRDHDYTDWAAVDAFIREFLADVVHVGSSPAVASALA